MHFLLDPCSLVVPNHLCSTASSGIATCFTVNHLHLLLVSITVYVYYITVDLSGCVVSYSPSLSLDGVLTGSYAVTQLLSACTSFITRYPLGDP